MEISNLIPTRENPNSCSVPECSNRPWMLYRNVATRVHYHFCGACSFRPGRDDLDEDGERVLDFQADFMAAEISGFMYTSERIVARCTGR